VARSRDEDALKEPHRLPFPPELSLPLLFALPFPPALPLPFPPALPLPFPLALLALPLPFAMALSPPLLFAFPVSFGVGLAFPLPPFSVAGLPAAGLPPGVGLFVTWLAFLSWPVIDTRQRAVRVLMIAIIAFAFVGRVAGWF